MAFLGSGFGSMMNNAMQDTASRLQQSNVLDGLGGQGPGGMYELQGIRDNFGQTSYTTTPPSNTPSVQAQGQIGGQMPFSSGNVFDALGNMGNFSYTNAFSNPVGGGYDPGRGVGFNAPASGGLSPRERQARAFGYDGPFGGGAYRDWWMALGNQQQHQLKQSNPISDFMDNPSQQFTDNMNYYNAVPGVNRLSRGFTLNTAVPALQQGGFGAGDPSRTAEDYRQPTDVSILQQQQQQEIDDLIKSLEQQQQGQSPYTKMGPGGNPFWGAGAK
jgi:hypothetical protein